MNTNTMKAVTFKHYGPPEVLQLTEIPRPTPKADEVLIKIHATTVTAGDWRMRQPHPMAARLYNGLFRPRKVQVLGFECAGVVAETGKNVTRFQTGDRVFAFAGFNFGCYAEYICLPEHGSVKKGLVEPLPDGLTMEEAAALPVGGTTALAFLRKSGVSAGDRMLVYGASGSVGTYAVQLAKHRHLEVTGVCSTPNVALVRELGADRVIDYTREELPAMEGVYDFVFDAVWKIRKNDCRHLLGPDGVFLSVSSSGDDQPEDLARLADLAAAGVIRPVIDRQYQLNELVEAHHYVQAGHKVGNVVVSIVPD